MTDPNYTALLVVIDRSGSMSTIREDMVGGLRTLISTQAAMPGRLTIDLWSFDDVVENEATMASPDEVDIRLIPRGSTALYDAIGRSVVHFGELLEAMDEAARPGTVQVIVVTDGEENSSKEYSAADVKRLVTQQTETYSWGFVFLGANQDAVLTGATLGFAAGSSLTYSAAPAQVAAATDALTNLISMRRAGAQAEFSDEDRDAAGEG
jgi:hypothetical protein